MKKKYNYERYSHIKKCNSLVRNNFCPNPAKAIEKFGTLGKVISVPMKAGMKKPIQAFSYRMTGVFYDKKTDSPIKGSFLYTAIYLLTTSIISGFFALVVYLVIKNL